MPPVTTRVAKLLNRTMRDVLNVIGRRGTQGLDIYGMLAVACATQHEVVANVCIGVKLKHDAAPEQVDLDAAEAFRTAFLDLHQATHVDCLAMIDTMIANLRLSCGAHDRVPNTPVPSVEELQSMFKLTSPAAAAHAKGQAHG